MKAIIQLCTSLIFLAGASLSAHAQTASPNNNDTVPLGKIALLDTRVFYEPARGIQKLIAAYKQLEMEFAPKQAELQALQNRIIEVNAELNKAGNSPARRAREEELERMQREFTDKQQAAENAVNQRRQALTSPILRDINKALQEFILARNITLLLDTTKLEGSILAAHPMVDVTLLFIGEFNAKYPAATNAANR